MSTANPDECCPVFDPGPWDGQELQWQEKRFARSHVISFLHFPLNYGAVMKRSIDSIESAGAKAENMVMLADEYSPWGSDLYLEVTKDVPCTPMASISGTFLCKVFEGPYSNMRKWTKEMKAFVESKGKSPQKFYFYYTTCPKCAKKYGKNYVVILAQV